MNLLKYIKRLYAKETFPDGSYIEPTTKESMVLIDGDLNLDFLFFCVKNHCTIYPQSYLGGTDLNKFKLKVGEYCLDRGYTFEIFEMDNS